MAVIAGMYENEKVHDQSFPEHLRNQESKVAWILLIWKITIFCYRNYRSWTYPKSTIFIGSSATIPWPLAVIAGKYEKEKVHDQSFPEHLKKIKNRPSNEKVTWILLIWHKKTVFSYSSCWPKIWWWHAFHYLNWFHKWLFMQLIVFILQPEFHINFWFLLFIFFNVFPTFFLRKNTIYFL